MPHCSQCKGREWLQVARDGDRPALRTIGFKGLQPVFGAWRMPSKGETAYSGVTRRGVPTPPDG